MEKSIYSHDYSLFLEQLRSAREARSMTQAQVAERLQQTQSFVSKVERGERRVDIVELHAFCIALDLPFVPFVAKVEKLFSESL